MSEDFILQDNILVECQQKNIISAVIPDGVAEIAEGAFDNCQNLVAVEFPQSLKKIGDKAFKDCVSLTRIDLSGVKILGAYAFADCTSLINVRFGSEISYLCNGTFENCTSLQEVILPENIVYIGCDCFRNCTSVNSVEMNGVMDIDTSAFENCSMLYSVTLPDTLLRIAPYAFSFCANLKSVICKNQFINIDETAFDNTIDITIRASQFSAAYRYALDAKHKCLPIIINPCLREIDGKYVALLKNAGIMFQMKPFPDNSEKAAIRFDKSVEDKVDEILGGFKNE